MVVVLVDICLYCFPQRIRTLQMMMFHMPPIKLCKPTEIVERDIFSHTSCSLCEYFAYEEDDRDAVVSLSMYVPIVSQSKPKTSVACYTAHLCTVESLSHGTHSIYLLPCQSPYCQSHRYMVPSPPLAGHTVVVVACNDDTYHMLPYPSTRRPNTRLALETQH